MHRPDSILIPSKYFVGLWLQPYANCERYQEEVKNGAPLTDEVAAYDSSPEYLDVST